MDCKCCKKLYVCKFKEVYMKMNEEIIKSVCCNMFDLSCNEYEHSESFKKYIDIQK